MARLVSIETLPHVIKTLAEDDPDREAFVFVDKYNDRMAFTRKELWDKSQKFAAILKKQGIERGDIVCNTLVNSPHRLITNFGTMTAGATTMHGQLLMADGQDLLRNLRISKCKAIIVDVGRRDEAWTFLERISYVEEKTGTVRFKDLPYLTVVITLIVTSDDNSAASPSLIWLDELEQEEMYFEENAESGDMASIFNTSGSTGFSKLVPFFHGKLVQMCSTSERTEPNDQIYSNRSLGWLGGFPFLYFASGCGYVVTNYMYGRPDNLAAHMVKVLEEEKCTQANIALVEVEKILKYMDCKPLRHLVTILGSGGGPMAPFIMNAVNTIAKNVISGYGGTEFGLVSSIHLDANSTFETYCTGNVAPGVELKIRDDSMEEVETGNMGEIFIRSPYLAQEYLNDPEKTKESFLEDGWYRTGDLGYQNEKGQLFVLGRKANAIMKGSFIFYPGWIEEQILKCPGIQSVVVIGVPDPVLHEDICVCLIPTSNSNLTEETVRDFCRDLFLTSAREEMTPMPKYFLFFDEFPSNVNLKIDTNRLKSRVCKMLDINYICKKY